MVVPPSPFLVVQVMGLVVSDRSTRSLRPLVAPLPADGVSPFLSPWDEATPDAETLSLARLLSMLLPAEL